MGDDDAIILLIKINLPTNSESEDSTKLRQVLRGRSNFLSSCLEQFWI